MLRKHKKCRVALKKTTRCWQGALGGHHGTLGNANKMPRNIPFGIPKKFHQNKIWSLGKKTFQFVFKIMSLAPMSPFSPSYPFSSPLFSHTFKFLFFLTRLDRTYNSYPLSHLPFFPYLSSLPIYLKFL